MANIVLLEDDQVIAESIVFALENDAMQVCWYSLGANALNHLNTNQVDLILLDIGLPDMSGFDVLREIRKISSVPVIIITARDDESDMVLTLEGLGADDYVTKPLSPRVLLARVRAQLRRTQKPKTLKTLQTTFQINPDLNQISLQSQTLSLTNVEYKILKHLLQKPNQIHSKTQLLDALWKGAHGSSESTIVTHIKSIRKALNHIDPNNEYIKNHRGLGYSLMI
jgi:two-component system catabolic regulation response regulator CreB